MCITSRKYLRHSKKPSLKRAGVTLFQRKTVKKKRSAAGSKLSPHKNVAAKSTKYQTVRFGTYKHIYNNNLYVTTLQYIYNIWTSTYRRVNVTDLGMVFLTPGIFSGVLAYLTCHTNFLNGCNNVGMPTLTYKVGQLLSNIKSQTNGFLASSAGTYSTIIGVGKGNLVLKLPSGVRVAVKERGSYLGPNIVVAKLHNYRFKKTLLRVRGIAKNPVDHPNGGRSNTKGSFKTPWGKVAKASK